MVTGFSFGLKDINKQTYLTRVKPGFHVIVRILRIALDDGKRPDRLDTIGTMIVYNLKRSYENANAKVICPLDKNFESVAEPIECSVGVLKTFLSQLLIDGPPLHAAFERYKIKIQFARTSCGENRRFIEISISRY